MIILYQEIRFICTNRDFKLPTLSHTNVNLDYRGFSRGVIAKKQTTLNIHAREIYLIFDIYFC